MIRRYSLVVAMLTLLSSIAFPQTKPVLTIRFDEGFDGASAKGIVAATPVGKPTLAPGKFGKALKSGPPTGYVEYPTAQVVNPACGTVEMWVCPLDWKPSDEEFHVFFETRGEGAFYLYKYYQGVRLLMLTCENTNGPYFCSSSDLGWMPGEWHHIAGTWSADGVMCYVDGKPARKMPTQGSLPKSLGRTFRIGDHPWHLPRTSSSLIDEVRIYDRALSPSHIAAHYKGDFNFIAPLKPAAILFRHEVDPEKKEVAVRLSTGGADVEDQRLRAKIALVQKGALFPEAAPTLNFTGGNVVHALPMLSTQPGEYEILARIILDDKQAAELRRDVIIPSTEWQGNSLGLEDKVLPPWTPIELRNADFGLRIECWGREYAFEKSPLPMQITSAGKELLARPVALKATCAGKEVAWKAEPQDWALAPAHTRAENNRGLLEVRDGSLEATRVRCSVTVEYDGVMLLEFSAPGGEAAAIEALTIEIPVRAEHAMYRHRWAKSWAGLTGNLPEGTGVLDKDVFIPYYWLGDNDRGLFWFCESDEMWPNSQSQNAIEVVRSGKEVVLRLSLLAAGQKLPPNWRFVCGLQATPVKPIPKDWRKWRLQPGRNANVCIIWPTPAKDSMRYFGYPDATDPESFSKRVSELHTKRILAVPYLCLSFLSEASPEWPFFRQHWAMGPVDTSASDVAAYGAGFAMVSPVGKDYSDFIIWKNKQFIDRYGIDGLYHDNTHPYGAAKLEAGLGYERDGKLHPAYPILGYRALYRRMYAVMKGVPRETFTMAHMSGKVTIPILAYDDSYLDGEHFRGRVKDSYMDLITLDTFRAEFMGRQWGIMPFFLPEFPADLAKQVEPTRGLMGLLMIHDVSVWPIWCNTAVANEALAALDEFGYVNSEFIPYFDPVPPAVADMKDVYVSAYKRADGWVLLIVANLSREDRRGEVRLNAERLGVPLAQVVSWPDKNPVEIKEGRASLEVPRLGYRMLVVGNP